MKKVNMYPKNLRILMRAIQGRGIKTAEAMIEEELKLYGGRLNQRRKRRKNKAMIRTEKNIRIRKIEAESRRGNDKSTAVL